MLSAGQYYSLIAASTLSSLLSIFGSSIIVASSIKDHSQSIYQRLVLSMSVTDVIGSVSLILHPFLLPRYTREYGFYWASGNQASCSAMGFFLVLCPTLVSFLSMLLSLYFYLKVKRNTQGKKLIKTFQILVATSVTLCLGIAVAGLAIPQGYAPRVYHNVCNFGDCVVGKLDECEYETGASWYLGWVQAVFIALPALIALLLTFMLYCAVRTKLNQSRRFAFTGQNTQRQNDIMMAVRNQAFLYSLAYWNSFFWYLFFGVIGGDDYLMVEKEGEPFYFAIQLLVWFFFPLQGFLNFLVYSRPRYIQWRQMNIHKGRWFALRKAVSLEPVSNTAHVRSSPLTQDMNNEQQQQQQQQQQDLKDESITYDEEKVQHQLKQENKTKTFLPTSNKNTIEVTQSLKAKEQQDIHSVTSKSEKDDNDDNDGTQVE